MGSLAIVRRLFEYDHWANQRLLQALQAWATPDPRLVAVAVHILAAEQIWLSRLQGNGRPVEPAAAWPALTSAGGGELLAQLQRDYAAYLDGLSEAALDARCAYTDNRGRAYDDQIGDVLLHVLVHAAQHRGEVLAGIGTGGGEAPGTDYIPFARKV